MSEAITGLVEINVLMEGEYIMYMTIQEAAEYLAIPETEILKLIQSGKIRAVYDGEQYVINIDQLNTLKQRGYLFDDLYDYFCEPVPDEVYLREDR
ncbi:MAG: excisionase family DNA-binding protein [Bacillales bacterium]